MNAEAPIIANADVVNMSFSTAMPGLQLAWDSVSRGALKKCPRYYQLSIINGWTPRTSNVHLAFGIWMHEGRERYYVSRAIGADHDTAVDAALEHLLCATWDRDLGRPWMSGDSNKNRYTLMRSLVWYLDQWREDPIESITLANGRPAVELSFSYDSGRTAPTGEPFLLCGHIDRMGRVNNQDYVTDLKTTKHTISHEFFKSFLVDDQLSGYAYAARVVWERPVAGIIVDGIQVAVGFSRPLRAAVPRTTAQLDEWMRGTHELMDRAARYATAREWPMNEKACGWPGNRCEFYDICRRSPGSRESWLRADFAQRIWDPMQRRGE